MAVAADRVRSPMVGRDPELARLVTAVSGPPAVVVLEGESGIGKTRLVSELAGHPELAGRTLVTGWCRAVREPFPLGPVLDAVRGLAGQLPAGRLSPVAGALGPLLPELAGRLPPRPAPLDDRVAERHRVFRALVEVLAAAGPLVLVLEDLHWADEPTVDFLAYLLAQPPPELAVVVTYRTEDVAVGVRALAAKPPAPVARTGLRLSPLDPAQTAALAAAVLGVDQVPDRLAADLHARTAGSPFAIEELLALLPGAGALPRADALPGAGALPGDGAGPDLRELAVPAGVRDPVLARVARLPGAARSVVEAVSVLATPAGAGLVAGVCRSTRHQVRDGLAEAMAAGVLVEPAAARVSFRHQLAAQAVYESIPGPRREELHERAAAALLASDPDALGLTAHHLWRSGQLAAWAEVAERAADQARRRGDYDATAGLLEDLYRHAPMDPDHRSRVAVKLAWAETETFRVREVGELLSGALAATPPGPLRGELRLLTAVALDRSGTDAAAVRRLCAEAVDELADRPDLRAWAMAGLGMIGGCGVTVEEHRRWLHRTLAAVPEMTDPQLRVVVLDKVASSLLEVGDPAWRRVWDQLESGPAGPLGTREILARYAVGLAASHAGHHRTGDRLLRQGVAGAVDRGNERLAVILDAGRAVADYFVGEWDGLAGRATVRLDGLGTCDSGRNLAAVRGSLWLARGELDAARELLGRLCAALPAGSGFDSGALATAGLIRIALAQDEVAEAVAVAERLRAAVAGKRLWTPLVRTLPLLLQVELAAGRPEPAARLLAEATDQLADLDLPLAPATLRHARGLLAAGTGRPAEAARDLLAAAGRYERCRSPYEAAQAREQAAAARFAAGDGSGAEPLRAALATYQRLAAGWDHARARSLARRYGVRAPAWHRGGRQGYGPLPSPREREVAALAAVGRTNPEIAAELYLSTGTVKKHLASVMRKLGVRSRTALAHRLATNDGSGGP